MQMHSHLQPKSTVSIQGSGLPTTGHGLQILSVPSSGSGHTAELLKSRDSSQASSGRYSSCPSELGFFCCCCCCCCCWDFLLLFFVFGQKQTKCRSLRSLENKLLMQCFPLGFLRLSHVCVTPHIYFLTNGLSTHPGSIPQPCT